MRQACPGMCVKTAGWVLGGVRLLFLHRRRWHVQHIYGTSPESLRPDLAWKDQCHENWDQPVYSPVQVSYFGFAKGCRIGEPPSALVERHVLHWAEDLSVEFLQCLERPQQKPGPVRAFHPAARTRILPIVGTAAPGIRCRHRIPPLRDIVSQIQQRRYSLDTCHQRWNQRSKIPSEIQHHAKIHF